MKVDYSFTPNETAIMKGCAVMAMLFHHLFYEHPEYGFFTYQLSLICKVCVAIFVFLSGYGLSVNYKNVIGGGKNTVKFVLKRLCKFYFNYWVVFLLTVPIGVTLFHRSFALSYGIEGDNWKLIPLLLNDFMGLQSFSSYNITWWFNRLILSLYILFPFVYFIISKRHISWFFCLVLFVFPYYVVRPVLFLDSSLVVYLFPFVVGVYAAIHIDKIDSWLNLLCPNTILVTSIFSTILFSVLRQTKFVPFLSGIKMDTFIAISLVIIVLASVKACGARMRIISFIGKHSMNIYMVHTFIYYYFCSNIIYVSRFPLIIFILLLTYSLLLSVLIEFIKKIIHIKNFENYLLNKILLI